MLSTMSRFSCPRCSTLLDEARLDGLRLYQCRACQGHAINVSQLRPRLPDGALPAMWRAARAAEACGPGCAVCGKAMRVIEAGKAKVEVDVCTGCQMLWLDAGEQEKLGVAAVKPPPAKLAGLQEAEVLLAKAKVEADGERYRMKRKAERNVERGWWIGELLEALLWWSI